ncbi:MAG: hypothetical protein R6V49_01300 [Bacteroidales bacterium]
MTSIRYFILCFLGFVVLPFSLATAQTPDSISNFSYRIIPDSLSARFPEIRFSDGCISTRNLDIKKFNDTIFLFVIPDNQDTLSLFTFYFDGEFRYYRRQPIKYSHGSLSFIGPGWIGITALNPDTIAMVSESEVFFYDLIFDQMFYIHRLPEHQVFTSNHSTLQSIPGQPLLVAEFLDFSKPESSMGIVETEIYAAISYLDQTIHPIPIFPPQNAAVFSITHAFHFALMGSRLVSRHSSENEFEIYDLATTEMVTKPIPGRLTEPETDTIKREKTLQELSREFMNSRIQQGMCYNESLEMLFVFYLLPVKNGNAPAARTVECNVFDADFSFLGAFFLDEGRFYPSMFFSFDDKIFLIEAGSALKMRILQMMQ